MRVEVDEAGEEQRPGDLDDADAVALRASEVVAGARADARDGPALDDDVDLGVELASVGRIDGADPTEDERLVHRGADLA